MERAEKERLKHEERIRTRELVNGLVKDQTYVLEATSLMGRYNQVFVSPSTNFVSVVGDKITLQTANHFAIGYNGLGGITVNGIIRDYQINEGKKGISVFIQFSDPLLGFSTLNLDVQDGGFARARVQDNWGGRVIFQGQLVPVEESRVFKGTAIM